ncbi:MULTISPECIES: histidinol-phosphate transaminase [Pseudidiomarina]|uniref:Histidinol-phosphate aminotransferase n=2 Tax=Pseudidiomarina TaxID=2800384 RepID=A0A368V1T5_9GAMM|nr:MULTISPECIES: histidinol-phosphate transaminase [Pseudidiomarina]PWW15045.1 histidinol-phosphate aminotransferase [Pseudidiomarina maritima]RBP91589.1 histidinol-phosphate aminotransferase [Pseudidiomarina tainanensis]RCW35019.1 histidinol-phosphate aminotransferase [Pseudidiomarina tainanensis]
MTNFDAKSLANVGVRNLSPYQAGKPIEELERELGLTDIVKLASNENPLGLSKQVTAALQDTLAGLARYPDANGFYLKSKLAEKLGVNINQITLGNGSNDVLELLARTFVNEHHEVLFSQHAFVVYPLVTQAIGAKGIAVPAKNYGHDLDAMAAAITDKTRMIFIANPNNPTGTFLTTAELESFLAKVPAQVLVVLDEAYYEYVPAAERAPSVEWVQRYPNLIVSRTFSKAYGLAGLRAGYAVTHADIADLMNRVRQPFNMNSLSLKAAEVVLDDADYLAQSIAVNQAGMAQLIEFCEQVNLAYIPSYGNFLTIEVGADAADIYQQLLHKGVIVRPVAGYELPNHLRVSIGLEHENQVFIDALKSMLL